MGGQVGEQAIRWLKEEDKKSIQLIEWCGVTLMGWEGGQTPCLVVSG